VTHLAVRTYQLVALVGGTLWFNEAHKPFICSYVERYSLALPDILAAGAGDGFGGKFFGHGIFANRTIFLPHDYTLVDFQGWPDIARNWRGLLAPARSNFRSHFAVEAVGIEASEPSSPQVGDVQIWYQWRGAD
jgi:hypothetical protein